MAEIYQAVTGFEPMHLDEIENGSMSFNEAAQNNIDWYEMHMHDAFNAISSDVPFDEVVPTQQGILNGQT